MTNNKQITEKILKEVKEWMKKQGLRYDWETKDGLNVAIEIALKEKDEEMSSLKLKKLTLKRELEKRNTEIKKAMEKCKEYKNITKEMDRDGASPVISKQELKRRLGLE